MFGIIGIIERGSTHPLSIMLIENISLNLIDYDTSELQIRDLMVFVLSIPPRHLLDITGGHVTYMKYRPA